MSEFRSFVLSGVMTSASGQDALLAIASVLHRRGVEVIESELRRPRGGTRSFEVTFLGTPRQAITLLRTMENQVCVVEARLYDHIETRTAC